MESEYQPIACGLHSEYELLAMHRAVVELTPCGEAACMSGRVVDVVTRQGAEFMVLELADGSRQDVRLDHIRQLKKTATAGG